MLFTYNILHHCLYYVYTGLAKKPDCFWGLITLRRLVI